MNLPEELIVKILVEYHGGFSYRNGKFMNKIADDDYRYKIADVIPHKTLKTNIFRQTSIVLSISPTKHYILLLYFAQLKKDPCAENAVLFTTDTFKTYTRLIRY